MLTEFTGVEGAVVWIDLDRIEGIASSGYPHKTIVVVLRSGATFGLCGESHTVEEVMNITEKYRAGGSVAKYQRDRTPCGEGSHLAAKKGIYRNREKDRMVGLLDSGRRILRSESVCSLEAQNEAALLSVQGLFGRATVQFKRERKRK